MSTSGALHRVGFLAGLRVLELGDGVAGAAATSLLWMLGADVTSVVDPASPHRRGRPRIDRAGSPASLLSVVLDRGKRLVGAPDEAALEELLSSDAGAGFDLVVVDRVGGVGGPLASLGDVGAYTEFVARHSPPSWLTISAFGLTGERAAEPANELTVAAASGMLASVRDQRLGVPLKLAGYQSLLNTGQVAALAACHAVDLAADGTAAHLDLSAVEATIATGPVLDVIGILLDTRSPGGAKRYGAPASFYPCVDGLVRISAMEDHQWRGVVTAMGSPSWADKFATVAARIEAADEVDRHVAAWTRTMTKADAETRLQAGGVPATAMRTPVEILDSPQLNHRNAWEALPTGDGRDAQVIGLPCRVVCPPVGSGSDPTGLLGGSDGGSTAERTVGHRRRGLRGLRVLEAGHVLAVPLAAAVLGALGAEVTKLEDQRRLDMYRRRGPYIGAEPGTERSAYFALANHSKRSVTFDVDADRGRLDALLDSSDVVLENLGRKRASALGLSSESALARHPDLLALSSSGFGQDGPHAAYRAYAYNLQAACALGYLTRGEDGEPAEIDIAWADLISAYAVATLVAAWAVGPSGNSGVGLDFAMADLIVGHFNEFLAAASLDPDSDGSVDRANELAPYAPHGVYPASDGWVALVVDGDNQFAALVKVLADESLADLAFARAEDRCERRGSLDECLVAATRTWTGRELTGALRAAGVPAELVLSAVDLVANPQLASRGFLTEVTHPEWGRRRLIGVPWQPFGGQAFALGPPPLLAPWSHHQTSDTASGREPVAGPGRD